MLFKGNFSYRSQFSLLIIGFVLALSLSSFVYLRWLQNNFIEVALNSQAHIISELIAEDMAQLMFLSDSDVLASITFKLQSIDELKNAVFYNLKGMPILKITNATKSAQYDDLVKIKSAVRYDDILLGYAELSLYSDALHKEKQHTNNLYLFFLAILILVGLALVFMFDKRFILRLTQLSSALKYAAEEQDFSKRLVEDKNDDIGHAKQYFNELVSLVEKQTKNLVYRANHDSLTGLYNRSRLISRLDKMLIERPKSGFHAVCYLDLDQFKVVNDTCGHAAGDELLKQLSDALLAELINDNDIVFGRIGGDEFIVLLKNKSKDDIHAVINKLQQAALKFKFIFLEREFQIGISLGCILFSNEKTSSSELFSAADSLCYQVKKMNRGDSLVRYLNDDQLVDYQNQMSWVTRIYEAFSQDRFRIYLQPIVAVPEEDKPWNHFEALIRLYDKDEIISPFFFIPVAERYGLTKKIDSWVIFAVFSQLKNNPQFLDSLELVSINLSVLSIVDKNFHQHVKDLFIQYELPYHKICFEITETGVISEVDKAMEFINDFRELGVVFSLDDFGSGMSSFGYLKDLAVDILKIDGQFVKNICHDPIMKEMVTAMINVGHISNKKVVAEHVEDKATVELITEMGVDYIQGYYYSKPLPINEFMGDEKSDAAKKIA